MTLKEGSSGQDVIDLQKALKEHNFNPGNPDGVFGPGTEAALIGFQKSENLSPDGIAGPATLAALGLSQAKPQEIAAYHSADITVNVTVAQVAKMFPDAPLGHISKYLPAILTALSEAGLGDKGMVLVALSTIRAETAGFEPISEFKSRFNTSPNGHAFDLYDNRKDLGNRGEPDGASFRGRGFVQLTGRFNYQKYDDRLGLNGKLLNHPELANDPTVAAKLLAAFLKDAERRIRAAIKQNDLLDARKTVNGGSHGYREFEQAYQIGRNLIA